jgi:hypothetical protein
MNAMSNVLLRDHVSQFKIYSRRAKLLNLLPTPNLDTIMSLEALRKATL